MSRDSTSVRLLSHRLAPPSHGATGIARYAFELAAALVAHGGDDWDVSLGSPGPRVPVEGVPTFGLGSRRAVQAVWLLGPAPRFEWLATGGDLLHVLSPFARVPTRLPRVLTVHDIFPITNPEWTSVARAVRSFRSAVASSIDARDVVLTPTEHVRGLLVDRLGADPDRVVATGEGAAGHLKARGTSPRPVARPYVCFVGTDSPRKNLDVLGPALRRLRGEVALVLLGPGTANAAARLATTNDLTAGVDVIGLGPVDDDTLADVLSGADALVHPSLDEGFGLTPLEAMHLGTPVISSDAASLPEVIGRAGLLVPPRDSSAWADAIARVVGEESTRAGLVAEHAAALARWTWAACAERTLAGYRKALGD